ncbi:U1 small nuclear ribonucleoprotein c-like finger [Cryptosporidium canis]|uniref:U1 small nuclear ribonucleoprotein c-like finger n=1 Tax=Cryptosporidium canis TaxID=195482 RepID=A0ABQ8P8Q6_9CRYT|nr:U1 small nuclear ribonucleoprotein c-like finger [Cryptosporidium canis]
MRRDREVSNKHYCEVCKIWIENHPNNLRSHQEGGRHKYNLRKQFKSESYRESQKKKNEDEVRKEFLKMQGVQEPPSQERRTIKLIDKDRQRSPGIFRCGGFKGGPPAEQDQSSSESDDSNGDSVEQSGQAGIIGQWEEVQGSESAYSGGSILEPPAMDLFKPGGRCVQVRSHSLSQNVYSNISEPGASSEEEQPGQKSPAEAQEERPQKLKIAFKPRKVPNRVSGS